jgi:hypothetical protein
VKIQHCSELHLEFPDNKEYIIANLTSPEADVLILDGDSMLFANRDKHNLLKEKACMIGKLKSLK